MNLWVSLVIISLSFRVYGSIPPPSGSLPIDFHNNALFARLNGNDENAANSSRTSLMPQGDGFIRCDRKQFHSGLRADSCADAVSQIPRSRHVQRYAQRTTGPEASDVGLPYRFISGKSWIRIALVVHID